MTRKKSTKKKTSKLRKTFEKVRILSLATPHVRKQLLQQGGREVVDCISECFVNILKGNVHLSPKQKSCLTKYKHKLREIAKKKVSLQQKKKIIQQGRFPLGAILAPVASVRASLLFR